MARLFWQFFWEMVCTPYLLYLGAVREFPKMRNRPANFISVIADAIGYCFARQEETVFHDGVEEDYAFLPTKTKEAIEKARKILGEWPFAFIVIDRDLHLLIPEEIGKPLPVELWNKLGKLLDETGGKFFATSLRDGTVFYHIHELVFPAEKGQAEKKVMIVPSERNKRIDSVLFLFAIALLYTVHGYTQSWAATLVAVVVVSAIRRTFFRGAIKFLQKQQQP